ncbi:vanadium-dependent haloperoxidase [Paraburkholderia terrae]|uniref:vanadium-dependent haloperoxidase n=1 Tax=Paraburkholderia terrae TaxID=311230 RepID=UPI00296AACC2|nr:vanadium-dependent haloperoxidase [Paraburkholderia terrae]MDW3663756.1 vanadium-dependent haloperoxidase [Paraburkholderia terrae]
MPSAPLINGPQPNGDENLVVAGNVRYIGNFHKTLPHGDFGEVEPASYAKFISIAENGGDFEEIDRGSTTDPRQTPVPPGTMVAKLINPQCGRSNDTEGPDPAHVEMQPAPGVLSQSTAAEMTELQWMAYLRDLNFEMWTSSADVQDAIVELTARFGDALQDNNDAGRLMAGLDLPALDDTTPNINLQSLFRAGLNGETEGPLVSQFFLQDCDYGAQKIEQTLIPYRAGSDYLTGFPDWLLAQNTGLDRYAHDYPADNNFSSDPSYYGDTFGRVRVRNMRDLARFVNRDALHQAYFNAALQLLNWNADLSGGNPYKHYTRQSGFGTLGGPNLLALVSEVASRALKVVWRQKWLVHRRLRPEAYGGLMQGEFVDHQNGGPSRQYGLPSWLPTTSISTKLLEKHQSLLLPIAYSAGSPAHPSYGAGHASVAGACVTILKAWFADDSFQSLMARAAGPFKDPNIAPQILQPGTNLPDGSLPPYVGADVAQMTIHGELNKLAANVALGRSMGGVHWRSDNTRSLRLGERVAIIILRRQMPTFPEKPLKLSFKNFDGNPVQIDQSGEVTVKGEVELTAWLNMF